KAMAKQAVAVHVKDKGLDKKWLTAHYHGPNRKENYNFIVYHDHEDKTEQLHVVVFDNNAIKVKLHKVKPQSDKN
ncbi:MAG: hypothetical protein HRT44_06050, partial [Bdellovibrionales bacterium]|nr:hypothetical protein [Bdellovibrionales bacterium]NQZ18805.1 hypothetical protein [Bdellovibrionales bacterium]